MSNSEISKNKERVASLWDRMIELCRMGKNSSFPQDFINEMKNCLRQIKFSTQAITRSEKMEKKEGKIRKEREKEEEEKRSIEEFVSSLDFDALEKIAEKLYSLCENPSVSFEAQTKIRNLLLLRFIGWDDDGVFAPLANSEEFKNVVRGKEKWKRVPEFISSLKGSLPKNIWLSAKVLELMMIKRENPDFLTGDSYEDVFKASFKIVSRLHKFFPNMVYSHWNHFNWIRFSVSPDGKLTLCA